MKKERIFFASNFILKIVAIIAMTLDHLGLVLAILYPSMPGFEVVYPTFRTIGRIALPLFVFMIVEGAIHTKKFSKYVLRLGIMATVIAIAEIIMEYVPAIGMSGFARDQGNIFIDLLVGAVAIYGLNRKGFRWKLLVLPCILVGTLTFVCNALESYNSYYILWYPFFLRSQYHIISMLLVFGFYFARQIASLIFQNIYHVEFHELDNTASWRFLVNLFSCLVIIAVALTMHAIATYADQHYIFWLKRYQTWMALSAIFLLFYNGKRGYNKKWFQYATYLYYPLHIPLLYGIVYLITIIIFGG